MQKPETSKLIALVAVAQAMLMISTWPLWMSRTEFPQVAVLPMLDTQPLWLHQAFSIVLLFCCLAVARHNLFPSADSKTQNSSEGPVRFLWTGWLFLASGLILGMLDQHRFQPWHWLSLLMISSRLILPAKEWRSVARCLLASIYLFAAFSRLGPEVDSEMSGQVLLVILKTAGLNHILPQSSTFFWMAAAMNAAEMTIGVCLLIPRTRRKAIGAAVLLHLVLLICLSPLGLNHQPGVLLWNLFLMVAVVTAFARADLDEPIRSSRSRVFVAVIFLIPISGLFAIADNWISWQVYSPRPEVVRLGVREDQIDHLPRSLQPFVMSPLPLQDVCGIRIDRWSLQEKRVPLYPEDRFQIAVVKRIVQKAIQQGARIDDFEASIERPKRFPWWEREVEKLDLSRLLMTTDAF